MYRIVCFLILLALPPTLLATTIQEKQEKKKPKEKKEKVDKKESKEDKEVLPHPLVSQIELAISLNQLIEPPGNCAFDLFQVLKTNVASEPMIKELKETLFARLGEVASEPLKLYAQGANRTFTRDDWSMGLRYAERARQLNGDSKEIKLLDAFYKGMLALADKEPAKAEKLFRQGLKIDDKASFLYNGLGRALSDQQQDRESLKAYEKAIEFDPQWTYPQVNAAIKYQKLGDLEKARQLALSALESSLGDIEAHSVLASIYESKGEYDDAVREYKQYVVAQRPNSPYDYYILGRYMLQQGDYIGAEQALDASIRLNPKDPRPRLLLGVVLEKRAKALYSTAKQEIDDGLKGSPNDYNSQLTLAIAASEKDSKIELIDSYQAALKIEPWQDLLRLKLARVLVEENRASEAIEEYSFLIKKDPSRKELLNEIGVAFKKSGKTREAMNSYRKAVEIDSRYVDARYNLALVYKEMGQLAAAEAECKQILSIDPNHLEASGMLKEIESQKELKNKEAETKEAESSGS